MFAGSVERCSQSGIGLSSDMFRFLEHLVSLGVAKRDESMMRVSLKVKYFVIERT